MKSVNPLISVIIPAFNHEEFIGEALDSVLDQTYRNLEVIVVDDGSTDNTKEVLKRYEEEIKYIYQQNRGVSSARNRGIAISRGEFIAFLDADDIWLPEKLEVQLNLMEGEGSIGLVGCGRYGMDYSGNTMEGLLGKNYSNHVEFLNQLLIGNIFRGGSTGAFVKKECFEKVGLFDESMRFGEDWDMWIRIAKLYKVRFVDKPMVKVRQHDSPKGYRNLKTMESNIRRLIKKNEDLYPWSIKRKAYSRMYTDMAMHCLNEKKKLKAAFFLISAICSYPLRINRGDRKIKLLLRSMIPDIAYQGIKTLRG